MKLKLKEISPIYEECKDCGDLTKMKYVRKIDEVGLSALSYHNRSHTLLPFEFIQSILLDFTDIETISICRLCFDRRVMSRVEE